MLGKSTFLFSKGQREEISWICGGVVAVVCGLWAVFTFFYQHQQPNFIEIQSGSVHQSTTGDCSPAIANVSGNVDNKCDQTLNPSSHSEINSSKKTPVEDNRNVINGEVK